jgi:ACR3 family arsenite efflux pump ArsB
LAIAAVVIVTQTLVEVLGMIVYVRLAPTTHVRADRDPVGSGGPARR